MIVRIYFIFLIKNCLYFVFPLFNIILCIGHFSIFFVRMCFSITVFLTIRIYCFTINGVVFISILVVILFLFKPTISISPFFRCFSPILNKEKCYLIKIYKYRHIHYARIPFIWEKYGQKISWRLVKQHIHI